ncbi:hypothetical protein M3Y99_00896700 [Aphelenchoides fujianensis]|nr:hypothetical protein M3Y99_00896700 [Aphelenchoides fujianensis]
MPPSPDDTRQAWVRGGPPAGTPVSARDPRLQRPPHAGGHEPPAAATPPPSAPAKRRATRWDQPAPPSPKRAATSEKPTDGITSVVNFCNNLFGAYAELPAGQTANFINYNPATSGATNLNAGCSSEPLNFRSLLAATQAAPTFTPPPPIDCLGLSDIDLRELMTIPPPPLSFPRSVSPPTPSVGLPAPPPPPPTATTPPAAPQPAITPPTSAPSISKSKAKNPLSIRAVNGPATPQSNPPTPPVEPSEQASGTAGGIPAEASGDRGQPAPEVQAAPELPAAAPVEVEAEVPAVPPERTERPATPDAPQGGGEEPMDVHESPLKEEPTLQIVEEPPPRPPSPKGDENIEWIVLPSDSSDASGEDSDDEVTILKVVPAPVRRSRACAASTAPAAPSITTETPDSTTPRQQKNERMEAARALTPDVAARRTCSTEAELPSIAQSPATEQPPADAPSLNPSSSDQLRVSCTFSSCGRVFSSTADYWAHQAEHVPLEQRHQCDLCAFFATNAADLERHRQVHSPTLRCKEVGCFYEASNPEDLRKHHRRKHAERLGYQCAKCDYQTIKKVKLKAHHNKYRHRGHVRIPRSAVQKRKKRQTGATGAGAGAADGPADVFEFTETPQQAKGGSTPLDPRIPSPPRTVAPLAPAAPLDEAPSSSGFAASGASTNSSGFNANGGFNSNSGVNSSALNSNSNCINSNLDRSIGQSVDRSSLSTSNSNPTSNSSVNAQVKHEQQLQALNALSERFHTPVDSAASAPAPPVEAVETSETDGGELNWATVLMSPTAPAFLYFDFLMLNATIEKMPLGLWLENDSCRHLLLHVRGAEWSEQPPLGRCVFSGVMNRTELAYDGQTNRSAHLLLFSKDDESEVVQRLVEELQSGPSFAELCDEILCGLQAPALILTTQKNLETCDALKLAGTSVQLVALA